MTPRNSAKHAKYPAAFAVFNFLSQERTALTTQEIAKKMTAFTDIVSTRLCYLVSIGKVEKVVGNRWQIKSEVTP